MKALFALIILIALNSAVSAQENTPQEPQKSVESQVLAVSETIDLYFDLLISLKTQLAGKNQKITSQYLSSDDQGQLRFIEETKQGVLAALKEYRGRIEGLGANPETHEDFEKSKLQYNIALIKALLPRYDTVKTKLITKLFVTFDPQFAEELISRDEALKLFFTQFDSNESTKDALSLNYRTSEIVKAHNAITSKFNKMKEANIYQVYPTTKIATASQESELYNAIIRGAEYSSNSPTPPEPPAANTPPKVLNPTLEVKKTGPDHFVIEPTCTGLFGM